MKKLGLLVVFMLFATLAFAGNKNDLAYYGFDELDTTAGLTTADELVVFEGDIPTQGSTIANILALSDVTDVEDANGDLSITRDLAVTRNETVGGTLGVTGISTFTDDITANADIVGDGGGEISGMLTDIEVGVTTDTLLVAETGRVNVVTTTSTKTLPTAADGLLYIFVDGAGCTITIDTGLTTDTIEYLTLDAGDTIDSTGATADSVTLIGDGTNSKWYVVNMKGSWTDGGAT